MIDNLKLAYEYYRKYYEEVHTPWVVSDEALLVTKRESVVSGCVASGEQGFIELMIRGKLSPGNYFTISPCYRPFDKVDETHQKIFLKLELISYMSNTLSEMIHRAIIFFNCILDFFAIPVPTEEGVDLEADGIELGSYGVREYKGHLWTYGTGLAEPRTSIARGDINGLSLK